MAVGTLFSQSNPPDRLVLGLPGAITSLYHWRKTAMNNEIEPTIIAFLAAQGPATLEEISWEVWTQFSIKITEVLPIAITAIAALQERGEICQYDPSIYFGNPLEFAWVLSEQKIEQEQRQADRDRAEWELMYYSGL
jgi:hypothetical protein